jgi:hypothetical protein
MGMRDESWCVDCGKSQPYSPDDVVCGSCTSEAYESRSNHLIEYIKLHLISLEQDLEKLSTQMESMDPASKDFNELDFEFNNLSGQTIATRHLLSVASDILGIETEEK